jgi:capsular polysaccharide transport system permease protein
MTRSASQITWAVWKALFLREVLTRVSSGRAAWFWLLGEPVFHVSYVVTIFTVVRVRQVGGVDVAVWIMIGMLGFFSFRRTGTQVRNAISANRSLFTYRQVKPIDAALVRGGLEGFLMVLITLVLLASMGLLGHDILPADPLAVTIAFGALWLLGLGFGLIASVAGHLVPEIDRMLSFVMMPLYLVSGVIFPISSVPLPFREWLMLNPVAHGLEAVRLGFAPYYHAVPELSVSYLYACALACLFLGLALQRRFALRLVTQ